MCNDNINIRIKITDIAHEGKLFCRHQSVHIHGETHCALKESSLKNTDGPQFYINQINRYNSSLLLNSHARNTLVIINLT